MGRNSRLISWTNNQLKDFFLLTSHAIQVLSLSQFKSDQSDENLLFSNLMVILVHNDMCVLWFCTKIYLWNRYMCCARKKIAHWRLLSKKYYFPILVPCWAIERFEWGREFWNSYSQIDPENTHLKWITTFHSFLRCLLLSYFVDDIIDVI